MPQYIYLEELDGPQKGLVLRYLKHAGENAIMIGRARYPQADSGGEVSVTPIPAEFPARDALEQVGVVTIEGIPRHEDELVAIPGIGKKTVGKILKALG